METGINSVNTQTLSTSLLQRRTEFSATITSSSAGDSVQFGGNGPLSDQEAIALITERALNQLRGIVDDAKAALGFDDDAVIDTSSEATADRILGFALGFFDQYRANHEELGEIEAREAYASFIGDAIQQGISEAEDILGSLSALTPGVENKISEISDYITAGLNDFVAGL
jgi:hypothetical protein